MSGYVPTTEQRDEIEDALLDYGMEREDSVFSFRATTPGFEGAVDRIVAVLAEARREGQAEAWDEGVIAALRSEGYSQPFYAEVLNTNPHREARDA